MTVRIVTDSACDLSDELCAEHGIEIVPLSIRFGEETLVDRVELSGDEFWERCAASPTLPETAAPSTGAFQEAFERAVAAGATGIICINISGDLSATIQSARVASKAVTDVPLEIVDTRTVSVGEGMVVLEAARAAASGASIDEILAKITPMVERMQTLAALDSLENLKKGGRIGAAQAMLGSLLNFKPVISISGEVSEAGKPRTRIKSLKFIADKVLASGPIQHAAVVHAKAPEDAQKLIELLGDAVDPEAVMVGELGPVVGTHGGRGVVGIAWC